MKLHYNDACQKKPADT
ncbi:uncharacterized protein FRV6_02770 [Fusarium oxysporum]|uniref:Uncharacterized protein n=1 Tax=Fusarium oxysporum TaxID=5507 RepID=A0A2H3SQ38_FUSOX|nr:uncharacterized protein FRV6_02770 [Fusarium oxysporum]